MASPSVKYLKYMNTKTLVRAEPSSTQVPAPHSVDGKYLHVRYKGKICLPPT